MQGEGNNYLHSPRCTTSAKIPLKSCAAKYDTAQKICGDGRNGSRPSFSIARLGLVQVAHAGLCSEASPMTKICVKIKFGARSPGGNFHASFSESSKWEGWSAISWTASTRPPLDLYRVVSLQYNAKNVTDFQSCKLGTGLLMFCVATRSRVFWGHRSLWRWISLFDLRSQLTHAFLLVTCYWHSQTSN